MSQYCQYSDLNVLVDTQNLNAFSNDYGAINGNNQPNMNVINSICTQASNACDAYVSSIYSVPFTTTPPTILQASIIFAAEILYQRRLTEDNKNPFKPQADTWRDRLEKIGAGLLPLDNVQRRVFTPVPVSVYKSRCNTNIF